jgi:hypothetical protein
MRLPKDWRELVESLNSHGVEYVIVGAFALAFHGFPRYTGDIDILVRRSRVNAGRLQGNRAMYLSVCGSAGRPGAQQLVQLLVGRSDRGVGDRGDRRPRGC